MAAANSRRPSCKCALPIRFVVSASRSFARPCRRWSTTRASAEAAASGALRTPEITPLKRYPLNVNDLVASKRVFEAFAGIFHRSGLGRPGRFRRARILARSVPNGMLPPPSGSWAEQMLTLTRRESGRINDLSVNHSPLFAPVIHPTLQMNVETLVVTAQGWFSSQPTVD